VASKKLQQTIISISSGNFGELHRLIDQLISDQKKPVVLGVSGGSATGKSSLTKLIKSARRESLTVFPLDEFQLGNSFADAAASPYRWDDPRNFDPELSSNALNTLISTGTCLIPRFSLEKNERIGTQSLTRSEIVVVEGLYPLLEPLDQFIDVGIYFEAPFFARFVRRAYRFTGEMGLEYSNIPVKHMLTGVSRAHTDYVQHQKPLADVLVKVDFSFENEIGGALASLGAFVDSKLVALPWQVVQKLPQNLEIVAGNNGGLDYLAIRWNGRISFTAQITKNLLELATNVDWMAT
jgi:uridine kinase